MSQASFKTLNDIQVIVLTNRLTVVNFSSPHPFVFTDGTILPACTPERATELAVTFNETVHPAIDGKPYNNIHLDFKLNETVMIEVKRFHELFLLGMVDIVLVPLPMMTALKDAYDMEQLSLMPFRCIRMESRLTKTVCIDKFCL